MNAAARYRFGRMERVRLWLSYQRYAMLLLAVAAAIVAGIAWLAPTAWWVWLVAALPVGKLLGFTYTVASRWPRKLRATALATLRIQSGRFQPRSVRAYCGDPCFRVVANEILCRAGLSGHERRRLIREFEQEARQPAFLLVVQPDGAVVVQTRGSLAGGPASESHGSNMEPT